MRLDEFSNFEVYPQVQLSEEEECLVEEVAANQLESVVVGMWMPSSCTIASAVSVRIF